MKKVLLSVAALATLSTSVMAFELVGKNESVVVFGGVTNVDKADYIIGNHDNVGSATAGHTGTKEDAGFSLSIGIEENVENKQYGSRKMLTIYNDGKKTYGDGNYYEIFTNKGIELSYDVFYKMNDYFKPYVGLGIGMNVGTSEAVKLHQTTRAVIWSASGKSNDMTGLLKIGTTGKIAASFEYFVEYKYRMGGESSQVTVAAVGTDLPNGVKHETVTVGLGYRF